MYCDTIAGLGELGDGTVADPDAGIGCTDIKIVDCECEHA